MNNIETLTQCPWCKSSESRRWGQEVRGFRTVVCDDCGLIYVQNRLNDLGLKKYYEHYLNSVHLENTEDVKNRTLMYDVEYKHITQYVKGGKVLDVGCSGGYFLDVFKENNFDCHGVEFGGDAYKEASLKHEIMLGELDKLEITNKYDLVIDLLLIRGCFFCKTAFFNH